MSDHNKANELVPVPRFECHSYCRCGSSAGHFEKKNDGVWVRYDDLKPICDALREISEGRGPFSTDQLTFATSVIEAMKQTARDALAALKEVQP